MTTAYIPTVGEYAAEALACFDDLQATGRHVDSPQLPQAASRAAVGLMHSCMGLMRKFPRQAREDFASVLPFTRLELELLGRTSIDDPAIAGALAQRLVEWATRSPILVDEANIHAASFLAKLAPHLDRWSERKHASVEAGKLLQV